jgi:hypothetical protein
MEIEHKIDLDKIVNITDAADIIFYYLNKQEILQDDKIKSSSCNKKEIFSELCLLIQFLKLKPDMLYPFITELSSDDLPSLHPTEERVMKNKVMEIMQNIPSLSKNHLEILKVKLVELYENLK